MSEGIPQRLKPGYSEPQVSELKLRSPENQL